MSRSGEVPLALFDVQTFTWNTNDCIGVLFHIEKLDHIVHIVEFLLAGEVRWLTKQSTKVQCLANSRCGQMQILLLRIACLALKGLIAGIAIDKHITGNDALDIC